MIYEQQQKVRFQHCDAAGIVFYPRYIEMLGEVIEDWLKRSGWPDETARQAQLHLAEIDLEFLRPSRLGDQLRFALELEAAEAEALRLTLSVHAEGEERFRGRLGLHCLAGDRNFERTVLPARLRLALADNFEQQEQKQ